MLEREAVRLAGVVLVLLGCVSPAAFAAEPVRVVASFSILGDLVAQVGGEDVEITTLVGPDGDAHVFEPTPSDARKVAAADLVVVNGLGFEGWLDRLTEASGYQGPIAIASSGITALEMGKDAGADVQRQGRPAAPDPHAWQSVANAEIYVRNVADALCSVRPAACADFRTRTSAYIRELQELDASIKGDLAVVAADRRKVITSHDAFGYFGKAYGVRILAPQGVSTEAEPSAADVAALIHQIRAERVTAVFVENIADPRLIEQIARETGARAGGELYSDALSDADGPASTYVDMMRHNAALLAGAMQGS